jgi:gamma-glutamylcyclotransferase
MLYFAYGSNMEWTQMRDRCPSWRFVGIAVMPDYRLAFTRASVNRGCGVADAVQDLGCKVWGVVYEISEIDVGKLDKSEGYRPGRQTNSYWRRECIVFLDGDRRRQIKVQTYYAEPEIDPPLPNQLYKNAIISGGKKWHLPKHYRRKLNLIKVAG